MAKKKSFDCVEMKNAIQARLLKEYAGLTDEEVRARIKRKLTTSKDPVAQKWRSISDRQQHSSTER